MFVCKFRFQQFLTLKNIIFNKSYIKIFISQKNKTQQSVPFIGLNYLPLF